jgi:hypothetical protein
MKTPTAFVMPMRLRAAWMRVLVTTTVKQPTQEPVPIQRGVTIALELVWGMHMRMAFAMQMSCLDVLILKLAIIQRLPRMTMVPAVIPLVIWWIVLGTALRTAMGMAFAMEMKFWGARTMRHAISFQRRRMRTALAFGRPLGMIAMVRVWQMRTVTAFAI